MLSQEARAVLLEDDALFILHYFGHRISRLEDFHLRLIANSREKRGLILYPAQHGKTTIVSTLLPIKRACENPNIQIGIIAKNDSEASGISQSIQAELMTNTKLIADFGPFRPTSETKPWASEKMTIDGRTSIAKEATFSFFGSSSKHTLGHRTHWTICDDVVTAENSATPEQRLKLRGWFNKSVRTMNLPTGNTTVVGTLFEPSDLYNDLMELTNTETGNGLWAVQREDAIVDEENKITLWPRQWSWPDLMELKAEMGTLDFNKRLRNIAVDSSRMVFKEEYVKGGYIGRTQYAGCLDRDYTVGTWDVSMRRMAGFDPAAGRGRSAKFCAHMSIGMGSCSKHEKCIWIIDLIRDQFTLPQQAELVLNKHHEYELNKSIIEANSYQIGLFDVLQKEMNEQGLAYVIEPHYTTRTNKPDPEVGVQSMGKWFENGWVHIPWGNAESQRKMAQFVDELIQYPSGRTTDTVMAFWFAWKQLQETAPRFKSSNYLRQQGSAWRSIGNRRKIVQNPYYAKKVL